MAAALTPTPQATERARATATAQAKATEDARLDAFIQSLEKCPQDRWKVSPDPTLPDPLVKRNGMYEYHGIIENLCTMPMWYAIDFHVAVMAYPEDQRVIDPPTVFVGLVEGRGKANFVGNLGITEFPKDCHCFPLVTALPYPGDSEIAVFSAMYTMCDSKKGKDIDQLIQNYREYAVPWLNIQMAEMPAGRLGSFNRSTKTIKIDQRLMSYSSDVRAAILAHEFQHAIDYRAGKKFETKQDCYALEENAFRTEGEVWWELWNGNLPKPTTSVHAELNNIAIAVKKDPVGFAMQLIDEYKSECDP
jgi:hypothetical protein